MATQQSDELVHALVLREMKDGIRRDGLWAQAMSKSEMDSNKATARYIELRVQSMKDELRQKMVKQIKGAFSKEGSLDLVSMKPKKK
ncbi:MAG: hypothetical protein EXR35_10810 [Limnohabitans sp.]|nr:hypothetical protein [Limnohabitans sp.]